MFEQEIEEIPTLDVIDLESTTLLLTLHEKEDKVHELWSSDEKWYLKATGPTRESWDVYFSDYGLNLKLYSDVPLKMALELAREASGAATVALRGDRGQAS